jgi:hypothetical protein
VITKCIAIDGCKDDSQRYADKSSLDGFHQIPETKINQIEFQTFQKISTEFPVTIYEL